MKADGLKLTVVAVAIAAALGGGYSLGHANNNPAPAQPAQATQAAQITTAAPLAATPGAQLPDMSGIVARNAASVVNISISGSRKVGAGHPKMPQLDPDDPMQEFFRRYRGPQQQGEAPVRGQGSGFILSADGTILTNAHVVEDADEVTVKLNDKREFKAKVVGADRTTDVAVLKIDAKDLPAVKIGKAADTRVGEWVLAIGSPFGFESSASAGIVSANSRNLPDGSYVPFIQTDVAVNPGNSGGPLFPIDAAMKVQQQLVTGGKVQRGKLGVAIQEVNQSLADSFGLKKPAGALVSSVEKDSPAAKAGLEPGDVILGINGKSIVSSGELPAVVAGMGAGETAKLQVWRAGASREIDVKVGVFADEKIASADAPQAAKGRLGVVVRPLSPEEQRRSDGGVVVQDVAGAAAKAGIKAGDIVLSVNGERISSTEQLRDLVNKSGKRIAVLVERGESRIFIPVELG